MKRKYLSALLMGTLTVASMSTFTSCKDYDDDISNLQGQIDKLATADQLSQKVAELQALISSNKSDITSLQSELAKKTTLDEVKAVLANYAEKQYVEDALATLDAAVKAQGGDITALQAAVKAAQDAADKAAADAKAATDEINETLKTLATKAEVTEVKDAANAAIEALQNGKVADLEKAQADILESLKTYAKQEKLDEVAKKAEALEAAVAKKADTETLNKAEKELKDAIKAAQDTADAAKKTAGDNADAIKGLATTVKNASDALKQANDNKATLDAVVESLGKGYSKENTVVDAIKAIQAQVGTPNKELGTLDTRLAAIESVLNGVKDDDTKLGLATKVTNIENKLKDIIGEYTTMVTEVSLVGSAYYCDDLNQMKEDWYFLEDGLEKKVKALPLSFTSGKVDLEKDYVFGKDEKDNKTLSVTAADQQKFVNGTTFNDVQNLVVRVNPTNAVLTSASIKLVDSQGNDLDNVLEIGEPKQYTGLITRASKNTGLWTIPVTVKAGVAREAVAKVVEDNYGSKRFISYAVAVKNTKTQKDAEDRYVASTYDVIVPMAQKFRGVNNIDGVQIWSVSTMTKDHPVTLGSAKKFTKDNTGNLVRAKNNETINIKFPANLYGGKVKYFYVVRDDHNTDTQGSDQSELNAWKGYKYDGTAYGKVIAADPMNPGTLKINIGGTSVADDEIGFRVFAINYDGTLASRSGGQSFVVYVGDEQNKASVEGNVTALYPKTVDTNPNDLKLNETGWLKLSSTLKNRSNTEEESKLPTELVTWVNNKAVTFDVKYSEDGKNEAGASVAYSKIKYVKFICTSELKDWKDNLKAVGTIATKNSKQLVENEIDVTLTKVLPTVESTIAWMGYKWKAAQKDNGKYTAYVYPEGDTWTLANATVGYKNMTQAINGLKAGTVFTVENIVWNNDTKKYSDAGTFTTTPWAVTVNKALIDGTTEHKTTISYNYGKISSEKKNNAGAIVDFVVPVETVQTVFACPLALTAQSYEWTKKPITDRDHNVTGYKDVNYLTYGSTKTVDDVNILDYIWGTNKFDGTVFGGMLSKLVKDKYAKIDVQVLSKESGNPDFFTATVNKTTGVITFHTVANASNPLKDVESELVITLTDAFGHKMPYSLPFTVKRAK